MSSSKINGSIIEFASKGIIRKRLERIGEEQEKKYYLLESILLICHIDLNETLPHKVNKRERERK